LFSGFDKLGGFLVVLGCKLMVLCRFLMMQLGSCFVRCLQVFRLCLGHLVLLH
jgi:hypothetical protein